MADWTTPSAVHSKCGERSTREAVKAIDSNTGAASSWNHGENCAHWIIFDMGSTKTITKIKLYQGGYGWKWGYTSGITVYVGDNPASLGASVWDGILNADGWNESGAFSKDGRYVKLVSKYGSEYENMHEFSALAAAAVTSKMMVQVM
jgi:hypothetical protein